MTLSVAICSNCGEPFDRTEYSLCNDCRFDKTYIKLDKEPIQDKEDGRIHSTSE